MGPGWENRKDGSPAVLSLPLLFVIKSQLGLIQVLSFKVRKRERKGKDRWKAGLGGEHLGRISVAQDLESAVKAILVKPVRALPFCP